MKPYANSYLPELGFKLIFKQADQDISTSSKQPGIDDLSLPYPVNPLRLVNMARNTHIGLVFANGDPKLVVLPCVPDAFLKCC